MAAGVSALRSSEAVLVSLRDVRPGQRRGAAKTEKRTDRYMFLETDQQHCFDQMGKEESRMTQGFWYKQLGG